MVFIFSCKKEKIEIEQPVYEPPCGVFCDTATVAPPFNTVWMSPIGISDSLYYTVGRTLLGEDFYLTIRNFRGPNNAIVARDLSTGEVKWTFSSPEELEDGSSISDIKLYEDKIVISSWSHILVVGSQTGNLIWKSSVEIENSDTAGETQISVHNGYIYHSHTDRVVNGDDLYYVRSPIDAPQWDTLFSVHKSDYTGFSPYGTSPSFVDLNGQTSGIFLTRLYNFSTHHSKEIYYSYNFELDSVVWTSQGAGGTPVVVEDKIYTFSRTHIQCFDAYSGELIWDQQLANSLEDAFGGNLIVVENQLVVKTDWHTIYSLNLETGDINWRTENAGTTPTLLQYYNGNVYYSTIGNGKLYGVNVQSGEVILEERSPNEKFNPNATFTWSGVRIDQETGYLYTTDGVFAMCIDLNE